VTTPQGGSLLNTVQVSSMLPHWVYMRNQASLQEDIWIPPAFNYMLVSTPAVFKCNNTGAHIQHPQK
jgi:hypothetical protein